MTTTKTRRTVFWFPVLSSSVCQNVTANHRVNDAVFMEDGAQMVTGRFMYGPLDMVTLTGEKVMATSSCDVPKKKKKKLCNGVTICVIKVTQCAECSVEKIFVLFPADWHPHHDPASLWRVGVLCHRAHQQQWTCLLCNPWEQKAFNRGVSCQNGGQVC